MVCDLRQGGRITVDGEQLQVDGQFVGLRRFRQSLVAMSARVRNPACERWRRSCRADGHLTPACDRRAIALDCRGCKRANAEPPLASGGRGNQVLGLIRRCCGGGAGSFSASPSANPVGRRRSCSVCAPPALGRTIRPSHSYVGRAVGDRVRSSRRPPSPAARACRRPPPPAPGERWRRTPPPLTTPGADGAALAGRPRRDPARLRAGAGQERDLRRQPDHQQAVPLRRRPPPLPATRATTAPAPSASRCAAAACSSGPLHSSAFMQLGRGRARPVDHGLHEPRPRLRRDRRPAVRHLRARASGARAGARRARSSRAYTARHPEGF